MLMLTGGVDLRAATPNPIALVIIYVIALLYEPVMNSSVYQGTLGKLAVGIKVTDLNGQRISFARSLGRYFSKILSGLLLYIGYLMIAFDSKKRGLHDKMAGTFVVKR